MFKDAWDQQASYSEEMFKSAKQRLQTVDKKIEKLVDHIMTSTNSAAVNNYEKRIEELEKEKILMQENLVQKPIIQGRFEELFKHTLQFIANPHKMWASGQFKHKRAVLKLACEERIIYSPKKGLRTPKTTLPFSMLTGFCSKNSEMVDKLIESSNHLFQTFRDWEANLRPLINRVKFSPNQPPDLSF